MKIPNADPIEATGLVPENKTVFRVLGAVSFSGFPFKAGRIARSMGYV
jgi:hypothetical protein